MFKCVKSPFLARLKHHVHEFLGRLTWQEPWHLPRGLHRLAPLAAKHQRQLQKLRRTVV